MKRLLKSFKTEINPTEEQKARIRRTIGTCRYVYNFYLGHNKALHDNGEKFMTGKSFSLWLNNEYIPDNPDKTWIREVYSKAVKKFIEDGCTAFTRFFKHQSAFPNFKKKGKSDVKNLVNAVHPSSIDFFTAFEYASLIHTFSGLSGMYSLLSHTLKLLPVINFSPLSYKALL